MTDQPHRPLTVRFIRHQERAGQSGEDRQRSPLCSTQGGEITLSRQRKGRLPDIGSMMACDRSRCRRRLQLGRGDVNLVLDSRPHEVSSALEGELGDPDSTKDGMASTTQDEDGPRGDGKKADEA